MGAAPLKTFTAVLLGVCLLASSLASASLASHRADWKDEVLRRQEEHDYETASPLIGILTQPDHTKKYEGMQGVSGMLVSWIEAAGGRVVPIRYGASHEELLDTFSAINGLVFPGGSAELWYGHPFFDTAAKLLNLAMDANNNGDIFPIHGVCLGFETLHILIANKTREELLVKAAGQEGMANTIELTEAADKSIYFRDWPERLLSEMSVDALLPTYNAHEWMVSPDAYEQHAALRDHFTVLSTTLDAEGAPYVSTVEGVQYPLFATQWHPEKPPYEFEDVTVPHTKTAIAAGFQAAQAFVDVARLNSHKVAYSRELELVIDNYNRVFLAREDYEYKEQLPDVMWYVPEPNSIDAPRQGEQVRLKRRSSDDGVLAAEIA